jgi:hypothetical protein
MLPHNEKAKEGVQVKKKSLPMVPAGAALKDCIYTVKV